MDAQVDDGVATDAKRLLLRYGAPIAVVDKLTAEERIAYARVIIRTAVPDRPDHLRDLLAGDGRMHPRPPGRSKRSRSRRN